MLDHASLYYLSSHGSLNPLAFSSFCNTMLQTFLSQLFLANETRHLTDKQLELIVASRFGEIPSMSKLPPNGSKSRIRIWRSEHNRLLWDEASCYSFRYGPEGVPINRNGNPLSPEEISAKKAQFQSRLKTRRSNVSPVS